jgi:hypothetical protein
VQPLPKLLGQIFAGDLGASKIDGAVTGKHNFEGVVTKRSWHGHCVARDVPIEWHAMMWLREHHLDKQQNNHAAENGLCEDGRIDAGE